MSGLDIDTRSDIYSLGVLLYELLTGTTPFDGWVVTGSSDRTAKIWDANTGADLHTVRGHTESVASVGFFPDGRRVYTASGDRTVKIWDAGPAIGQLSPDRLTHRLDCLATSPNGRQMVLGGADAAARASLENSGSAI